MPSSSWTCARISICTLAAVLLQTLGVAVFILGFFPAKPALSGVSGPESFYPPGCGPPEARNQSALHPDQLRSLYQVVDGLPSEFLLGKDDLPPLKAFRDAMPYTQSLLLNGMATGYHAKAAPPTVTMPRLKAMVSGAIGGFLDVAFNFNTQAFLDDNLLGQFLSVGWKMVMLGDNTWLKLFPGSFTRHDGVSSFFVRDTVQVDHNVSRHLMNELTADDWDLMILHYLGLDHVGHIGGRNSILMPPKLKEMDDVVRLIHSSTMLSQNSSQGRTLLVVVSDHGMTENGNHGGSSYEETDSLALFVVPTYTASSCLSATYRTVNQVDIAPTLALLFGVPIPKNNVGILIESAFDTFTDEQKLRALELNSWQLFRLLQVQLPGLSCGGFSCDDNSYDEGVIIPECSGDTEKKFCCLYRNAIVLHKSISENISRYDSNYSSAVAAYNKFLRTTSGWLLLRATDKPTNLLAVGVAAMLLSGLSLWIILYKLCKEVCSEEDKHSIGLKEGWPLDEAFIVFIVLILLTSMVSSSMVEEEHYIWHYMTSTLYFLFFHKTLRSYSESMAHSSVSNIREQTKRLQYQICCIVLVLLSGRILRGWHQGGVNWTNLPDISKWLEHGGSEYIQLTQLLSVILLIFLGYYVLYSMRLNRKIQLVVGFIFFVPGLLVLQLAVKFHDLTLLTSNYGETFLAQTVYVTLGVSVVGIVVALPWLLPASERHDSCTMFSIFSLSSCSNSCLLEGLRDSSQVIGWTYAFSWCLLQLLLQQPLNSMPILLLFVQVIANLRYHSYSSLIHKQWVKVAALYCMGMAGHFALGNSNTLATIDVAGAFIGISTHSTLLSGILMFIITYASPMLVLLGMVMHISVDPKCYVIPPNAELAQVLKIMIAVPCLVPLSLNSAILITYTIVLLLMQNHLFIWSVFSPKYLYVCATTVCTYIGVCIVALTMLYIGLVVGIRRNTQHNGKVQSKR